MAAALLSARALAAPAQAAGERFADSAIVRLALADSPALRPGMMVVPPAEGQKAVSLRGSVLMLLLLLLPNLCCR